MKSKNLNIIIIDYLLENKNKLKINSNDILNGDVFVSLQGTNTHGNIYIKHALKKGARFIITDKKPGLRDGENNILLVKETLGFLLKIASEKRNIFKGKVIGITGSVGKTTIKENLKFFLSTVSKVSASIKSYNNYLGVLISIINIDLNSNFAIFEIGTNNFNEVKNLTSIIIPQQIIITNIFPTHIENFKNTRNIAKEKSDIFNPEFNSNVNLLILPNSNNDELFLYKQAKKMKISEVLTLGKNVNSNYCIQKIDKKNKKISIIKVKTNKKLFKIEVNSNLYHQIYNIIICFIIFQYNNLNLDKFYKNAKNVPKIEGRGLEKKIYIDNKQIRFIDESYNASPVTMKICVNYFQKLEMQKNQKKFLILGNMNELGKTSKKYHQKVIRQILNYNIDNVILCGKLFKSVLNDMKIKTDKIIYMSNEYKIMQFLKKNLHNNDTILIKGSNLTKVNNLANMLILNRE